MQGEGERCLQTSPLPPSSPLTRLLVRACPSSSPSRTPQAGGLAALILPAALHEGIATAPGCRQGQQALGAGLRGVSRGTQDPPAHPGEEQPFSGVQATFGGAEPGSSLVWVPLLCRLQRKWRM